jgi:Holliday junction resolvase-like predicted endonuclease
VAKTLHGSADAPRANDTAEPLETCARTQTVRSANMQELSPTTAAIVASVLGLVLGAWLALALRRTRETLRARAHNARGRRAENAAAKLLESNGYRIVGRQDRKTYVVRQGETDQKVELIIDFVVEKGGERFAAEVKSGGAAAGIERADTRRQLLEYQLVLGSKRVLLVDPEHSLITTLAFPIPRPQTGTVPKAKGRSLTAALVSLVIVVVVVVVLVTAKR